MSALRDTVALLEGHFGMLRDARRAQAPGAPLFGLEHPLNSTEISELGRALREALKRERRLSSEHGLAWVVLAAECGYGFGGAEFWPKFEDRIPEWGWLGDRYALRRAFQRFVRDFNGKQPSGQWAEHFCLISWPITHAILPRDLQRHLCEAVYAARYNLWGLRGLELDALGKIVARTAPVYGTRFDDFIRDHALVGAVVHRLLVEGSDAEAGFYPDAFARILRDLHSTAAAQEWLGEAARLYSRGVSVGVPRPPSSGTALGLRPRSPSLTPDFILVPDGARRWVPNLLPPSLVTWVQQHPDVARELDTLSFGVASVTDRLFPAESLLAARPAPVRLSRFPRLDEPLIHFVPRHEGLTAAFEIDCRLPSRLALAFRVSTDHACLVAKGELVPGETYLLATRDTTLDLGDAVPCVDPAWQLRRWCVPSAIDPVLGARLLEAGLSIRRTTRLRPWALVPRRWDEDTAGEWLVTEPIVLVVERDHMFDAVSVAINGASPIFLECGALADPTLVLDELPAGTYPLTVGTFERRASRSGTEWHELGRCEVQLRVRSPTTWSPGHVSVDALRVEVDPPRPSLKQFLQDVVVVTVDGNAPSPVEVSLICTDGAGTSSTKTESIIRHRAPILSPIWLQRLTALQRRVHASHMLMGAQRAYLRVACEPLGERRIPLSVVSSPVRWGFRQETVRLLCDGNHEPEILHASFHDPAATTSAERSDCQRGLPHDASGLFVAQDGAIARGVVVGRPAGQGLAALGVHIPTGSIRAVSVPMLLAAYRRWDSAMAASTFASTNQARVLRVIHAELLHRHMNSIWRQLEAASPLPWEQLEEQVDFPGHVHSFGYTVGKKRGVRLSMDELHTFFVQVALDYQVTSDALLIDAAWFLAAQPTALSTDWNGPPTLKLAVFSRLLKGARVLWLGNEFAKDTPT